MDELTWHKSTYSAEAANCIEIAPTPTTIHIRDSKHPAGPHLTVALTAWEDFLPLARVTE
ncbi:DUF397 domain-containing protein [Streptomyces seoulensis]|nr:DUF397 domain-containing protein [Streptomyces seoulensis]